MDFDEIISALRAAAPERSLVATTARYAAISERAGVALSEPGENPSVRMQSGDDGVTLRVSGPIDPFWGCDVRQLIADMDEADPEKIHLLIESPGGYVSDGLALYADLTRRRKAGVVVTAQVVGMCASAAILPLLAAEKRSVTDGGLLMIHNAWTLAFLVGDKGEIEAAVKKVLAALGAIDAAVAGIVSKNTGLSAKDARAALDAETWYEAEAAVEAGFVSEIENAEPDAPDAQALAQARAVFSQFLLNGGRLCH